ncbi:MAG TPA: hypothetical protein VGR69_08585 [Candidatus Rubrimentiphilum sp.]|nr:hypothetical protein [Candidatus Rubrimentiphilum sp.]
MGRLSLSIVAAVALAVAPVVALAACYIHVTGGLTLYHSSSAWESKPCSYPGSACCWFLLENEGHEFSGDKWDISLSNPRGESYNCTYHWKGRSNTVDIAPPR